MVTDFGEVGMHLYDDTPIHRDNFLKLAQEGFFNGMAFHRVINNFMVQVGDPRTKDQYPAQDTSAADGPGYTLQAEFSDQHVHRRGVIGAARWGDEQNPERRSSGSQFYVVTGRPISVAKLDSMEQVRTGMLRGELLTEWQTATESGQFTGGFSDYLAQHPVKDYKYPAKDKTTYLTDGGAPWLDFTYTVFGEVTQGMEVIDQIEATPVFGGSWPKSPIRIQEMRVLTSTN
ncbi:peptidylprolyl isomerase [Pontibacter sp. G13]|uniref:peptidylprolyl isomerase n=1 Tax=Pontibacter sp. G13 TaxID=3074898 RepID=UPI00288B562D|nr:peptidylprolyl isomerase [Pontibacter sp. G13]WNJ20748.1 peptidylprolyl isomerase [Pontibacter sp. G13]